MALYNMVKYKTNLKIITYIYFVLFSVTTISDCHGILFQCYYLKIIYFEFRSYVKPNPIALV